MRGLRIYIIFILTVLAVLVNAQETTTKSFSPVNQTAESTPQDTITTIQLDEEDLMGIGDLRSQFEKQNSSYSTPKRTGKSLLRFINKGKIEMSPEAKALINNVRNSSALFDEYMTFADTIIVNPIFLPLVFRGSTYPEKPAFYDPDRYKLQEEPLEDLLPKIDVMPEYAVRKNIIDKAYNYITFNNPNYIHYSERDMPNELLLPTPIQKDIKDLYAAAPLVVQSDISKVDDVDAAPIRFIPDRLYWRSAFESSIQFSQNYVSPNWHKGGSSNLNLFTRNHLKYDYKKDKIQLTNEFELKINAYTAPKDTLRNYKIGDDLFRIHNNLGYQAFNNWYYTLDSEFKTQLFKNYKENEDIVLAALLAPMSINLGIGMKYELDKKFTDKHKKLKLAVNLAPFSYTFMYSIKDDIDMGRHGFEKDPETGLFKNSLSQIGSTIRTDLSFQFNRNVTWQSRIYYFTSYDRVVGEFENTLTLAISRFFSTRISAHLRFDDGVTKTEDFDSYWQLNELLSFGFNYKW